MAATALLAGCVAPQPQVEEPPVTEWTLLAPSGDGESEPIGSVVLTDPTGGGPRPATVGRHGLRVRLAGEGDPRSGETVRVVWSRRGAADTRATTAVEAPDEPGVYLATIELPAPGQWTLRVEVVDGGSGSAVIEVS